MVVENKKVKSDDTKKSLVISFSNDDYVEGFNYDYDDPMVIIATIHNYVVKRILVDQWSSTDNLYNAIIASMNIHKIDLKPYNGNLIRFF